MKTFRDKINLLIIQKTWTMLVLSIVYILILRGGVALCDIDPRTLYDQINATSPKYIFMDDNGNLITLYEGKERVDIVWGDKQIDVMPYTSPYKYSEISRNEASLTKNDSESKPTMESTNDTLPKRRGTRSQVFISKGKT